MPTAAYINGYQPFTFSDLSGGLNLRDKADTIGDREAIDLLNVTFSERGAVRQRDGYRDLTPADLTNRVDSLAPYYSAAGLRQLVAGCGTRLEVIDNDGTPVAAGVRTGFTGGPWTFARFGDPTHEYLYAGNGIEALARWNGSTWAAGGTLATVDGVAGKAMPKASAITVTAATPGSTSGTNASNRLVATGFGIQATGGPGGTVSTPSRVYFSNPGQPEVWETDGAAGTGTAVPPYSDARGRNWIDLTPGDGERIQAAVTWRELVFIFKETKFFVLWGESTTTGTDNTVITTFHVREVVNAIGLACPQAVAVGRDGVYFMNRRGVYRTNGGDPQLLSDIISPLWMQDPDIYYTGLPINLAQLGLVRMLWHMERLYIAIPTGLSGFNDRVLVYDTQHEWWSLYDVPMSALASFRSDVRPTVHFGYATGDRRIGKLVLGAANDRDTLTIPSWWRSGWSDYGNSQVKTIRESKIWGTGAVSVSFSVDFNQTLRTRIATMFGSSENWPIDTVGTWGDWLAESHDVWPGSGQVSNALVRYAIQGTVFSTQFSNSDLEPSWAVHRVARHLREIREPSIR